uniref:MYM-type domain-containing protein n=1 Tax=Borely moumouvirus TaxID=2712067 RepID=A0A6G6AE12_9VIRU
MFLHPAYNNNLFTKKCKSCDLDAKVEFRSGTVSYYRNKNAGIYNFCSFECMDKFNRTKKCWFCSYYSDLISCESGFMVCTSSEYWKYSCHNKYYIRARYNLILDEDPFNDDDYDKIIESYILPDEYKEYIVKHNDNDSDNDSK